MHSLPQASLHIALLLSPSQLGACLSSEVQGEVKHGEFIGRLLHQFYLEETQNHLLSFENDLLVLLHGGRQNENGRGRKCRKWRRRRRVRRVVESDIILGEDGTNRPKFTSLFDPPPRRLLPPPPENGIPRPERARYRCIV